MYIIRSQGFFYTDEYFAPTGDLVQVVKQTFATREEAEAARAMLVRKWVRSSPVDDFVSLCADENDCDYDAARAYMQEQWPDYNPEDREPPPAHATDEQIDELVKRSKVRFAEVFEVSEPDVSTNDPDGDEAEGAGDDLYYGPAHIPPASVIAQPPRVKKSQGAPTKKPKAAPTKKSKASAAKKSKAAPTKKSKTLRSRKSAPAKKKKTR